MLDSVGLKTAVAPPLFPLPPAVPLRNVETEAMEMVNASGEPLLPDANRNAAAASLKELAHYFH
jgi:hypothetical protein